MSLYPWHTSSKKNTRKNTDRYSIHNMCNFHCIIKKNIAYQLSVGNVTFETPSVSWNPQEVDYYTGDLVLSSLQARCKRDWRQSQASCPNEDLTCIHTAFEAFWYKKLNIKNGQTQNSQKLKKRKTISLNHRVRFPGSSFHKRNCPRYNAINEATWFTGKLREEKIFIRYCESGL